MTERWLPVVDWGDLYEVSSEGRLRALPRVTSDGRNLGFRTLRGALHSKTGYTNFSLVRNGRRHNVSLHRLVCEAFHGPAPDGKPWVLHRDGDPKNNRAGNLYWGDASDNNRDAVRHGTHYNASKTRCPRGHLFSEGYRTPRGWRLCRQCILDRQRRRGNP